MRLTNVERRGRELVAENGRCLSGSRLLAGELLLCPHTFQPPQRISPAGAVG